MLMVLVRLGGVPTSLPPLTIKNGNFSLSGIEPSPENQYFHNRNLSLKGGESRIVFNKFIKIIELGRFSVQIVNLLSCVEKSLKRIMLKRQNCHFDEMKYRDIIHNMYTGNEMKYPEGTEANVKRTQLQET